LTGSVYGIILCVIDNAPIRSPITDGETCLLGPAVTLNDARAVAERWGREVWDESVRGWQERGYTW
jgi:hypothetical protein